MKLYHNPRCSKSRNGLKYLQEKGHEPEIVLYLKDAPFTEKSLADLIKKTEKKVFDFVRTHEADYKKNYKGKTFSDTEWVKILVENPKFIHRPIFENGNKAVLANPPENAETIL